EAVEQVSAGWGEHTCAVDVSGMAYCWGKNDRGQLGNGTILSSSTPVILLALSDVAEVAAGGEHSCARLDSGAVYCWGENGKGQLGNDSTTDSLTPVEV